MQSGIPFWQLLTVVAVPTLMIFIGLLFNRQDYRSLEASVSQSHNSLDAKIDQLRNGVDTKIDLLHDDMIMVHSILREFEGRLSRLESRPL